MKRLLLAALLAAAAAPAFAADTMPPKTAPMHEMKHRTPVIKPAREPSTDKLNQQQLDAIKS